MKSNYSGGLVAEEDVANLLLTKVELVIPVLPYSASDYSNYSYFFSSLF
tara:strand:- start:156 stop:302 length:147 start_codon:yes stop_codon:yes gene_type:complete